jgi:hypothetical protein
MHQVITQNKYWNGLFILIGFSILIGVAFGLSTFYKPARDAQNEAGIQITANELFAKYAADQKMADSLFLDKTIEVTGSIIKIGENQEGQQNVELKTLQDNGTIFCTLKLKQDLQIQQQVTLKGICKGYRDQMMVFDVVLVDCYLIK